eukprot:scaffold35930_cov55-Attheya_sp.AAC.2
MAEDVDRAEGALEEEEAARSEIAAYSDEATTAVCEYIPLLDIVCDVVGGDGAASLEMSAASEAAKSFVIYLQSRSTLRRHEYDFLR